MTGGIAPFLKTHWVSILVGLLVGAFLCLRLFTYGDLRLSIGTSDTPSYLVSDEKGLLSADVFTRQRLLTTTILYRFTLPQDGYHLLVVSSPAAADQNPYRQVQPDFEWAVMLQVLLSVFSWLALVLIFARYIQHPLLKVGAVLVLLFFAFMPQTADWDSILASESLSMSLFALSLALLIEIVFWFTQPDSQTSPKKGRVLLILWSLTFFLFAFTRDSNIFMIIVTILLMLPFLPKMIRSRNYLMLIIGGFLVAIFLLGYTTSQQSGRWKVPLSHVYSWRILPHPLRVAFMRANGMPDPNGPEFDQWFDEHAPGAYLEFLIHHPGYALLSLFENMEIFFSENEQPYFIVPDIKLRSYYLGIGNLIHPNSSAVFLIDMFILGFLWLLCFKWQTRSLMAWVWLANWLFLSAFVTLFISYHSDSIGIIRHVLGSILYYRLFLWLFLFVVFDQSISQQLVDLRISDNQKLPMV